MWGYLSLKNSGHFWLFGAVWDYGSSAVSCCVCSLPGNYAPWFSSETLALYKSLSYLLTYLLTYLLNATTKFVWCDLNLTDDGGNLGVRCRFKQIQRTLTNRTTVRNRPLIILYHDCVISMQVWPSLRGYRIVTIEFSIIFWSQCSN